MIKVVVNGAAGKMGRVTCGMLREHAGFELLAGLCRGDDLAACLEQDKPDVVVDFTLPYCVFSHAKTIIEHGVRPVIGTSGLSLEQIEHLKKMASLQRLGGVIVPNFSMGAMLMMRFAKQAAAFFDHVDIVELHHEHKVDAPSGTARKTAEMLARQPSACPVPGAYQGVPIHSVRLPGLFAHQSVVLDGLGESLTIKHDAYSRDSMMSGVRLACERCLSLTQLHYGLENVLFDVGFDIN